MLISILVEISLVAFPFDPRRQIVHCTVSTWLMNELYLFLYGLFSLSSVGFVTEGYKTSESPCLAVLSRWDKRSDKEELSLSCNLISGKISLSI